MTNILEQIVETKRVELERSRRRLPLEDLQERMDRVDPPRDFFTAVTAPPPNGIHLIAEIKKASPSAGLLIERFDPAQIAQTYHRHGASALSVLTDETYFRGALDHIEAARRAVPLPVLRKDFLIDEYQIYEARAAGADAVLLIGEVLEATPLAAFHMLAHSLGMTTLVESHSVEVLKKVLGALGSPGKNGLLLGINNRDLTAQKTSLDVTERMARHLPDAAPFVAESGIATRNDVLAMQRAGARAILVGESLLRSADIGTKIDDLLGRHS